MNHLLFFCVCCALTLSQVNAETIVEKLGAIRLKCAAANGLTRDDIAWAKRSTFLDNPLSKCYLACLAENLNLFKDNNAINKELSRVYVRTDLEELAHPILEKCVAAAASVPDRCEKAHVALKCVKEEDEAFYFSLTNFYRLDGPMKDDAQFEA